MFRILWGVVVAGLILTACQSEGSGLLSHQEEIIAQHRETIDQLEGNLSEVGHTLEVTEAALASVREMNAALEAEKPQVQTEVGSSTVLVRELSKARAELSALRGELQEEQKASAGLEQELEVLEGELVSFEEEREELVALKRTLAGLEQDEGVLASLRVSMSELNAKVDGLEQANETLLRKLITLDQDNQGLLGKVEKLEQVNVGLLDELAIWKGKPRWVLQSELEDCLRRLACSGITSGKDLIAYPAGQAEFTFRNELSGRSARTLLAVLAEFEELFDIVFVEVSGSDAQLTFRMGVAECSSVESTGCTKDWFIDSTKSRSLVYVGEGRIGTIRHELIHAITPIGHPTRSDSVMTAAYGVDSLSSMDRGLVWFFLHNPAVRPGKTIEEVLADTV